MSLFFRPFKRQELKRNKAYCLGKIMQIYHNNLLNDSRPGRIFNGLLIDIYKAINDLPLEYAPYYVEVRREYIYSKIYAITLFFNYKKSHARIIFDLDMKRDNYCYIHSIMNITKDGKMQKNFSNCESVNKVTSVCIKSFIDKFFEEVKNTK